MAIEDRVKIDLRFDLKKPVIGLRPAYIWETVVRQERIHEITDAMTRKIENDERIGTEWIEELISHIEIIRKLRLC